MRGINFSAGALWPRMTMTAVEDSAGARTLNPEAALLLPGGGVSINV